MKYKYDVFISYSRKDYVDENYNVIPRNAIAEIQNVFDENNITYWFDKDGIYSGQEFIEIITSAIAESKMLIFISSKHSNASIWTAGEIFEAVDGQKVIIPIKIDDSQYNNKFKLLIRPLDYIDYQESPKNALKNIIRAINKVKEDIEQKQREEEEIRLKREAEAKKEKIKNEISILTKDYQHLTLQQTDIAKQIYEKLSFLGNTTKACPICNKEVSISSIFCSQCGWIFPILYSTDGSNSSSLDEKQMSVARTNWRNTNTVNELRNTKEKLEIEIQQLQHTLSQTAAECKSTADKLKESESALEKTKIEIKQIQAEADSQIKHLQFLVKKRLEEHEASLQEREKKLLYSIEKNEEFKKCISNELAKAKAEKEEIQRLYSDFIKE